MKKYLYLALGVLAIGTIVKASNQAKPETKTRTLNVKMNYSGSGVVDEKHKIFVFIFDSPDFMQGGAMPIGMSPASAKDGTVTFADLTTSPIYVTAAYDPSGAYDGQSGPPPSGASLGMYSKTPGKPEPVEIEAGKAAAVDLPFDDTAKMP